MRDQGFVSYLTLLLLFLIVGVFSGFFFAQNNFIRKEDEDAISNRLEAYGKLLLASRGGQEVLGRTDGILSQASFQAGLSQALNDFLSAYGRSRFDCPTGSGGEREKTATFLLYPTSYQNAQGSCAEIVKSIAASVFPEVFPPTPSRETPTLSGGRFLYEVNSASLPYAFVVVRLSSDNRLKGVSVLPGRITVRSIESPFPLPYQIGQISPSNALRNNPMAPGHIWDAPVLITRTAPEDSSTGGSRLYEVYAASALPSSSSMPAYFEYGLLASGCRDRNSPTSCSYRAGSFQSVRIKEMNPSLERWSSAELPGSYMPSRAHPPTLVPAKGVSYYGRYWATPNVIVNHIASYIQSVNIRPPADAVVTFIPLFSLTNVELEARSPTEQIVRIGGIPYGVDANRLNIFVFSGLSPVRVRASGDYAIAPRGSRGLAFITDGDIRIAGPLLSQEPYCQRPPLLRRDAGDGSYFIERGCSGSPPRQPLYLISLSGNIEIDYLQPEVALNGVFLFAPRGAFRLSSNPVAQGDLSGPLGLHLVGGLWVDTFGPWQTGLRPGLSWRFTFTALPLASDASTSLFPQVGSNDPVSTFLVR